MTRYWAAIDSSLADAEKQLKDSRRQINDAKKKLEEQSGTAYAQLVAAAQQLADAKDQASLGSTLTSAEVKAIQAVLAQYDNMVNLRDSYNASEDYARTHLSAVKYAELQSLQLTRTQLRAQLKAAQASLETAEAALKEIGSSEAALQQDVTNAKDAQEAAQTAYNEALDGAPERLKDDPGWKDLLRQEQEKQAEVDNLQAQLEKDPDNTGLQAQLNTAEAELAAIQAEQTAYINRNDPQTVAAAEKLSAAEEEVTRANARLETFQQATEAKAEAEKAIADATKAIEENTAAIKLVLGEAEGKKWIESHDKVQDDYGTITELNAAIDALAPRIPQLKRSWKPLSPAKRSWTPPFRSWIRRRASWRPASWSFLSSSFWPPCNYSRPNRPWMKPRSSSASSGMPPTRPPGWTAFSPSPPFRSCSWRRTSRCPPAISKAPRGRMPSRSAINLPVWRSCRTGCSSNTMSAMWGRFA